MKFGPEVTSMATDGHLTAATDEAGATNPDSIQISPADPSASNESRKDPYRTLPSTWDDDIHNLDRPVPGWPKVALMMAKTPDFAAFDRFRDINIKSLLYYQTQLTVLRKKLHKQEHKDHQLGDEEEQRYAKHAYFMVGSINGEGEEGSRQWKLVLEIRTLLKEYSQSIDILHFVAKAHCL